MKERRRKRFVIVGKCEERKSNFKDFFYIYYFNLKGQCLRGPAGQSLPGKLKITPRPDGKRVISNNVIS